MKKGNRYEMYRLPFFACFTYPVTLSLWAASPTAAGGRGREGAV